MTTYREKITEEIYNLAQSCEEPGTENYFKEDIASLQISKEVELLREIMHICKTADFRKDIKDFIDQKIKERTC